MSHLCEVCQGVNLLNMGFLILDLVWWKEFTNCSKLTQTFLVSGYPSPADQTDYTLPTELPDSSNNFTAPKTLLWHYEIWWPYHVSSGNKNLAFWSKFEQLHKNLSLIASFLSKYLKNVTDVTSYSLQPQQKFMITEFHDSFWPIILGKKTAKVLGEMMTPLWIKLSYSPPNKDKPQTSISKANYTNDF